VAKQNTTAGVFTVLMTQAYPVLSAPTIFQGVSSWWRTGLPADICLEPFVGRKPGLVLLGHDTRNLSVADMELVQPLEQLGHLGVRQTDDRHQVGNEEADVGTEHDGLAAEVLPGSCLAAVVAESALDAVLGDQVRVVPLGQAGEWHILFVAVVHLDVREVSSTGTGVR
jgi:hypothetical protein